MAEKTYEYSGAIHIHSTYSDGSGSIPTILNAAKQAELDFIVLTDHNSLGARVSGWEGWHGNLLLVVGEEVSSREGHCLAIGTRIRVNHRQPLDQIVGDIKVQQGLSFVAHPHGVYRPLFKKKNHSWRNWSVNSYTGLEVWSFMFDWVKDFSYFRFFRHYLEPERHITGPFPQTLERWDQLCQTDRVVGIGGVDAHARRYPVLPFTVFPYEMLFKTVRTHVLVKESFSGESSQDISRLLDSIQEGHCFLAYDLLANAKGTYFGTQDGSVLMGDECTFEKPIDLEIRLPHKAEITVIKNGQPYSQASTAKHSFCAESEGVYRIEARLEGKPWIYTNPIYLRPEVK